MSGNREYDIVFAGGGTSACVIASRLAAADPSLKILVLEAGPHTRDLPEHYQPARFLGHLRPDSTTVTHNIGKPSDALAGRPAVVSCAHCVGGASSINLMMYTRASASDYDDWANVHQNAGWGSADLLPLLKKVETYQIKDDEPTHGYSGPLKVSYGGVFTNLAKDFLEVAAQYDKKRSVIDDANNLYSCNAYARWQKWIDGETGRRSDVPHHYLYNRNDIKNLEVRSGCQVIRVIFEDQRAVGLEYRNDPRTNPDGDSGIHVIRASRMVVVSAGAFGSPAILERSGIGAKTVLGKNSVEQVVDLPGVGENYQDHNSALFPFLASKEAETIDTIVRGDLADINRHVEQWNKDGQGFLATNGIDAGVKLRPYPEELEELGPEFQAQWSKYYANAPDKAIAWMGLLSGYLRDQSAVAARNYFSLVYFTTYPSSTGYLHITSGTNPNAALDFDPGFLTDPQDLAILRYAYKKARELARRLSFFEGELSEAHPTFAEGSGAAYKDSSPVAIDAPDIVYSKEDDKVIDAYHRSISQTSWHSLGTCAMKPRESGGVVDAQLNVYGVRGLKVADMSIAPANVGSNTYSTALVIGEKAATIIARELGLDLA